jgi:hypothetical protein
MLRRPQLLFLMLLAALAAAGQAPMWNPVTKMPPASRIWTRLIFICSINSTF